MKNKDISQVEDSFIPFEKYFLESKKSKIKKRKRVANKKKSIDYIVGNRIGGYWGVGWGYGFGGESGESGGGGVE